MTAQEALAPTAPSTPIVCRGIRGATTAAANTAEDILEATQELVTVLIALNELSSDDIASAIFTTSPDLTAMFPALAARSFGWTEVPMMCAHEMAVPGALDKAVRVLVHVNTTKSPSEIRHVYLKGAKQLRPEWGVSDDELAQVRAGAGHVASAHDITDVPVTTSSGISS
jgi:chorismate mutase